MNKTKLVSSLIAFSALALILFSSLVGQNAAEAQDEVPDGVEGTTTSARHSVPDFTIDSLTGDRVRLSDYGGKVIVISFWATWCVPCLQELAFLQEYFTELEEQGLVVLAVTTDGPETQSQVRAVVRRGRWTMPVLLDQDGSLAALINPRNATPYTMFVDRSGHLAFEHEGYTAGVEIEYLAHIHELLAEPAP